MTTSSPYCRSEMRPEYLAEFEAAGVPPYSQVRFPGQVYQWPDDEPTARPPYSQPPLPTATPERKQDSPRMDKVVLDTPGPFATLPATFERQREAPRTRKVILDAPERYATRAIATNIAAIVLGLGLVFFVGFVVPMMFVGAFLRGITKASRRGRWHHW